MTAPDRFDEQARQILKCATWCARKTHVAARKELADALREAARKVKRPEKESRQASKERGG